MLVRKLRLQAFRNFETLDYTPGDRLNVLVGLNAQGKSNLLESLYLLATTRSLRASRESEMVRHGEEFAMVAAEIIREREPDVELEVTVFRTDKKSIRVNGVRRGRILELLGQLNAVHFSASDLAIVSGDPSVRRRYLNLEISQVSPKYVYDLASYKKALEQRNRLLRDYRDRPSATGDLLDAYDEQMVAHGATILDKRRFYVERLAPLANDIHRELTDGAESLHVRYAPYVPLREGGGVEEISDAFRQHLKRLRGEETRRGVTLTGPQRDDLQFLIDGNDARLYGSQGQQRTVVLSLKLAEYRLMQEYVGEPPIMLLDDVLSDLDEARRGHLLAWLRNPCQVFLTCTELSALPVDLLAGAVVQRVSGGALSRSET